MKILILGGSGFIGNHLCRRLLNEGNQIICLDNNSTGSLSNIQDFSFGYWLYAIDNGCYTVTRGKTSSNVDSFDNLINFNSLYIALNVFQSGGSPSYNTNLVGGWNHIFYTVKQSASPYTVTLYVNGSSVTSAAGLGNRIINTFYNYF